MKNNVFLSEIANFKVGDYTFEIGRLTKGQKQIASVDNAFVVKDDIEYAYGNILVGIWVQLLKNNEIVSSINRFIGNYCNHDLNNYQIYFSSNYASHSPISIITPLCKACYVLVIIPNKIYIFHNNGKCKSISISI